MQTENNHIENLFNKYLDESITREEFTEFWTLLGEQNIQTLSPQLQNLWLRTEGIAPLYSDEEWNRKLKALIQKAEEEDAKTTGRKERNGYAKNAKIKRIPVWTRWAAAAVILIAFAGLWIVIDKHGIEGPPVARTKTNDVQAPKDSRAVITLADGSKVYLDSVSNGVLAQQNNVNVVKNNKGEIVYAMSPAGGGGLNESPNNKRPGVDYNTLSNPRGSKVISLTLSDGTKVWLNAESSLRYPASFASSALNREVEITGEAYFEVKHNAKQPFKVHLPNGSIVEDLGTAFNINAYADEADIKTTLIEGSLRVFASSASSAVKLVPGQQSVQIPQTRVIRVQNNVDLEEVTSWKNGRFSFTDASIETILKEISRYYDAEIVYTDKIPGQFVADISRDVPVSKLLHILELTNRVHFKIEGKKITVLK
jgi:transmembrane sensor